MKIKELKKELLDLEGRQIKDGSRASSNKTTSGYITLGVGLVGFAYGIGYDLPLITVMGVLSVVWGVMQMIMGKQANDEYEKAKIGREQKIIDIKKELLDLE